MIPGLYEQLITVELQRLLSTVEDGRAHVGSPESPEAHIAVADHLRRILERALRAVPEDERLSRLAEICNALLAWLRNEQGSESIEADDALVVPLTVLREVRALTQGAAFTCAIPQPLVPLSAADLLVNARGEPSVGAAIEREIYSADFGTSYPPFGMCPRNRINARASCRCLCQSQSFTLQVRRELHDSEAWNDRESAIVGD